MWFVLLLCPLLVLGLFDLLMIVAGQPLAVAFMLLTGWIHVLWRVPDMPWSWPVALAMAIGLVVVIAGAQALIRRWRAQDPTESSRPWPLSATLRITGVAATAILAGIALVGTIHLTSWVVRDGTGFSNQRPPSPMITLLEFHELLDRHGGDPLLAQRHLLTPPDKRVVIELIGAGKHLLAIAVNEGSGRAVAVLMQWTTTGWVIQAQKAGSIPELLAWGRSLPLAHEER